MTLRRKVLIIAAIVVLLPGAALFWLGVTESGLQFAWEYLRAKSPVPLAGEVHGRLIGPMQVKALQVQLPKARIEVADAALDWEPLSLLLGRLRLKQASLRNLVVTISSQAPATAPSPPRIPTVPLLIDVEGVITGLIVRWDDSREVRFDRLALDAVAGPRRLKARYVVLEGYGARLETEGEVGLRLEGSVRLATRWVYQLPKGQRLGGKGQITGTLSRPLIEEVIEAGLRGEVKGGLTWIDRPFSWHADAAVQPFEVTRLYRRSRPLVLGGRLRAEGGGGRFHSDASGKLMDPQWGAWNFKAAIEREEKGWRLSVLKLAEPTGKGRIQGSGLLHTSGDKALELALKWSDLSWVPSGGAPGVASPRGELSASGSLEGYRITGLATLARPGLPDGAVELTGEGNREGMALSRLKVEWLKGELLGNGSLHWRPHLAWMADLRAKGLDPGSLYPEWPGTVSGKVTTRGERRGRQLSAELALTALEGRLRGNPLTGEAIFALENDRLQITKVALQSGASKLDAEGELGARWDLRWELDAKRVDDLWPGAAGQIRAKGSLQGSRTEPHIRVEADGKGLAFGDRRLAQLDLLADLDLGGKRPSELRLVAAGLALGERKIERVTIGGEGVPANHRLTIDALARRGSLHLEAEGSYSAQRWRGKLHAGRLSDPSSGVWHQTAPAPLALGAGEASLGEWCWSRDDSAACLTFSHNENSGWKADVSLRSFPISVVQPFITRDLQITGNLEGRAGFAYHNGLTALDVRLTASDGTFRFQVSDGEAVKTPYRGAELSARSGSDGIEAKASLQLANGDHAQVEFALPRWRPGQEFTASEPVRGNAEVAMGELVWISLFVPDVVAAGRLESSFHLTGTLGRPLLQGRAALTKGQLAFPLLGIEVSDLRVEANAEGNGAMVIRASARSGPGQVSMEGRLNNNGEGWSALLNVSGKNVEVARLPQAHVLATPDLKVELHRRRLQLSGKLVIPKASVNLPQIEAPVQASPDVVVVDRPEKTARASRWTVVSEVTVIFGDEVHLTGYGFSGRLGGQLVVAEPEGGGAVGRGELRVIEGKYEAYGQTLTIEQGRLLYGNAPINNPGIEFRAVRQLPDAKVGIVATGRLKKPEVRLFSEPPMDDTDVLAYLVLGRALNTASKEEADLLQRAALSLGVGSEAAHEIANQVGVDVLNVETSADRSEASLVLGKYLSPRLYVQYAVGFWEAGNEWQVLYRMGRHWTIKGESGPVQSGVDVLYTIEK